MKNDISDEMKRAFLRAAHRSILLLCLSFAVITACGEKSVGTKAESNTLTGTAQGEAKLSEEELTRLLNNYLEPSGAAAEYEELEDVPGFPAKLVNLLGKAVYEGNTGSVIRSLDDKSLRLSEEELLHLVEKSWIREESIFYRVDMDGDGVDELLAVPEEIIYYPVCMYRYEKSGERYIFRGTREIGGAVNYSIFQYEGVYYLAADCSVGPLGDTNVRLFRLDGDLYEDRLHHHICVVRQEDISNLRLLYQNYNFPAYHDLESYVDEILRDLISVGSGYGTFYGDETEQREMRKKWRKNGLELENLYSIDADNDGHDEYFERNANWLFYNGIGSGGEMVLSWFHDGMESAQQPIRLWENDDYVRRQTWFKVLGGQTVVFSLYHKEDSQNQYVIDARLCENGETRILYDCALVLHTAGVEVVRAEIPTYAGDTFYLPLKEYYIDPDREKAFPDNLDELADSLKKRNPDRFSFETNTDILLPSGLVDYLKAFLTETAEEWDYFYMDSYSNILNKGDFLNRYGISERGIGSWQDTVESVYEYQLGSDTYFLVPSGDPAATSVNYNVFKEDDGKATFYSAYSSAYSVGATESDGELYLIEPSDDVRQSYPWGIDIHKLAPDQEENYASVKPSVIGYKWEKIYDQNGLYGRAVTEYLDSVSAPLMDKAGLSSQDNVYTGDENSDIDRNKLQRLKSIEGEAGQAFYEIDFDNDGALEYFSKRRIYYDTLIFNAYRFEDKMTVDLNYDLRGESNYLSQLWFKKLDGKIFTFKMIAESEYFFLNVSLVEGDTITQVQSYIIIPEREYLLQ